MTPWAVLHYLPEFAQTQVYWIGDAIQPSHPLSSPSPPDLNLSKHQGLFKWVSSSHQVAKVLEFYLQHQSFQRNPRTDLLYDGLVGSLSSPRDSQESSPTPQFNLVLIDYFAIAVLPLMVWFWISVCVHVHAHSLNCVWLSVTARTAARLLCPWILQARILESVAMSSSRGIFPTQESNLSLLCLLY